MEDGDENQNLIRRLLNKASQYNNTANVGEIARRYFVMNAFDGVLTII